jgi:HSP20 family protein
MISTSPLNAMLDRMVTLGRSMDTALNQGDVAAIAPRTTYWIPDLDAWETEHAFVVTLDLPGVVAERTDITFERNTLTVTGVREPAAKASEKGEFRLFFAERPVGHFSRSLRFPQYVEGDKISAHFDHGVLTITVPKAEAAKSRKIAIGATAPVNA